MSTNDFVPDQSHPQNPLHEAPVPPLSGAGEPPARHVRTSGAAPQPPAGFGASADVDAAATAETPRVAPETASRFSREMEPTPAVHPTMELPTIDPEPAAPAAEPTGAPQPPAGFGAAASTANAAPAADAAPNPAPDPNIRHTMEVPNVAPQEQKRGFGKRGGQVPGTPDSRKPADKRRNRHPFVVGIAGGLVGAVIAFLLWGAFQALSTGDPIQIGSESAPTVNIDATGEAIDLPEVVAAKCLPSVASLTASGSAGDGVGSGVVFDDQGNILTNYHVVEGAQTIDVTLGGMSYEGTLVGSDESSDLAVVNIDPGDTKLVPMEIGDSSKLVVGQWVMSLGSPFGLDQSVSTGIVSSLYRSTILQGTSGNTIYTNLVQTDAAINPGNSGGALVNAEGQLIGINSTIMSASGSSSGVGFAIPSNYAAEAARTIISGKQVEHAYLGANVATVTAASAARNHFAVNQGAYIASVVVDGPAAQAGLEEGDIVVKLGDTAVTSADGLILAVRSHNVGDQVELTYYRGTQEHTVTVTLGSDANVGDPIRQQSSYTTE